jgi:hypothetical protein
MMWISFETEENDEGEHHHLKIRMKKIRMKNRYNICVFITLFFSFHVSSSINSGLFFFNIISITFM